MHKRSQTWDFEAQMAVEVDVVFLRGKGKSGNSDGSFGQITPRAVDGAVLRGTLDVEDQTPF